MFVAFDTAKLQQLFEMTKFFCNFFLTFFE